MPPRQVTRRPRDEEEEEEETPRKARKWAKDEDDDDEEEERRPARGVRGATRSTRKDDDDEKPRTPLRSGWAGAKRVKESSSDFAEELKFDTDEGILIKFLQDEPFTSYRQHWIERKGKKSFICLEDGCPLCDIGDRPSGKYCFNVLLLSEGEPQVKVWVVGSRLFGVLEKKAEDKKTGPLTRLYWQVERTGKGSKAQTSVDAVKERDLGEDWEMEPLEDDVLERYLKQCYDESAITVQTRKQLKDIAHEVSDEDDDD